VYGGTLDVAVVRPRGVTPPTYSAPPRTDAPGLRFGAVTIRTDTGDLFLSASARLLHRVAPVVGPRARFTLGGFLALDARRERVLSWS